MSFRQAQCRPDITRPVEPGKLAPVVVAEAVNEGGCAHNQEAVFKVAVVAVQDAFVLTTAGVVVVGPKRPVELVELVDGHGGGAAVYHPALGLNSAAIIVGEGVLISSRLWSLPKVARRDSGQSPFA